LAWPTSRFQILISVSLRRIHTKSMQLTGPQLGEARKTFEVTFDVFTFPRFLKERLNKDPWLLGAPLMGGLSEMIEAVARRANNEGWIGRLLASARESVPDNEALAALTDKLGFSAASRQVVSDSGRQVLEEVIKKENAFLDVRVFLTALTVLEYQVCRMEVLLDQGGTSYGTGFLVAPDLVITNYHVIEALNLGDQGKTTRAGYSAKAASVRCRFDYKRVNNETINEGTIFALAPHWKYDTSDYDPPGPKNLDYAILRLEKPAGDDPIAALQGMSGARRGFIKLPDTDYPFTPGSPLWILQHPSALPLKLAFDTNGVVQVDATRSRVTYTTNTEGGSSGSPCFNQHLIPVALHHSGDPSYPHIGRVNEGIPLSTIRRLLRERGLEGGLG